jgi:hypothetical protein
VRNNALFKYLNMQLLIRAGARREGKLYVSEVVCMHRFCLTFKALKADKQVAAETLLYQAVVWNEGRGRDNSLISTH